MGTRKAARAKALAKRKRQRRQAGAAQRNVQTSSAMNTASTLPISCDPPTNAEFRDESATCPPRRFEHEAQSATCASEPAERGDESATSPAAAKYPFPPINGPVPSGLFRVYRETPSGTTFENYAPSATCASEHPENTDETATSPCAAEPEEFDENDLFEEPPSVKQVAAAALMFGQNVRQTAEKLGINRRTIQRWQKSDPEFQAAWNTARREVVITSRQSMLALLTSAVDMVEEKLKEDEDPQIALAVLRGCDVISPEDPPREDMMDPQYEEKQQAEVEALQERLQREGPPYDNVILQHQHTLVTRLKEDLACKDLEDNAEAAPELEDLDPEQQIAVREMLAGKTIGEVAAAAEVRPSDVRDWLTHHWRFYEVLSNFQFERMCHLKHRIFALVETSIRVLRQAMESGQKRYALALVRGFGLFE